MVEIPTNPYQGLKHAAGGALASGVGSVEIPTNPYQGLKQAQAMSGMSFSQWEVEIPTNPYQGLKLRGFG